MSIASAHESPTVYDVPPKKRSEAGGKQTVSSRSPRYAPRGEIPDNAFARLIERRRQELGLSWYDIATLGGFGARIPLWLLEIMQNDILARVPTVPHYGQPALPADHTADVIDLRTRRVRAV